MIVARHNRSDCRSRRLRLGRGLSGFNHQEKRPDKEGKPLGQAGQKPCTLQNVKDGMGDGRSHNQNHKKYLFSVSG
jgi:hypothetical protein